MLPCRALEGNTKKAIKGNTLNSDSLAALLIPLPPLAEQHRIVAKVDELMRLCDQLEQTQNDNAQTHRQLVSTLLTALTQTQDAQTFQETWSRIAENFEQLFTTKNSVEQLQQTILQLAVMGKLVEQEAGDEPASVLLEKIAQEKARLISGGKIKKSAPLLKISDDEKPFDLPNGWEWTHLPDVGELARGKSKHRPRNDPKLYSNGNIPLVQTGDVSKANPLIKTCTNFYNEIGLKQSRLWKAGTMCITIAANIADTGILDFDACFPDSIVGFIPFDKKINIRYFEYFFRTAKNHLESFAPSTAQKNINLEILSDLLVPLPPLNELNSIVAKVDELMAPCEQLKTRLNAAQSLQWQLAEALVLEAVG